LPEADRGLTEERTKPKQGARTGAPRRRRAARAGLWGGAGLLALALVLAVGVGALIGTRVTAPDWLRERIAARIDRGIDGLSVGFGELSFVIEGDWVPKLALQRVVIRDAEGVPLARLSDLRGSLALGPLFGLYPRPRRVALPGGRGTLRRAAAGLQ